MKSKDYIKKNKERLEQMLSDSVESSVLSRFSGISYRVYLLAACLLIVPIFIALLIHGSPKTIALNGEGFIKLSDSPIAIASAGKGVISVPVGHVNPNPFVPYRNINGGNLVDVPSFELVEPPEQLDSNSDAARVMDTIVSGILYDKYSPSAILNIEGNDYLVKKGDVINNYKVLNIMQNAVTVRLGKNVYTAGIGEILTEGNVNYNNVPNLSNRFGGVK